MTFHELGLLKQLQLQRVLNCNKPVWETWTRQIEAVSYRIQGSVINNYYKWNKRDVPNYRFLIPILKGSSCLGNYCRCRSWQLGLVRERVTTRSKIVGMISFVRETLVQNTARIVKNVREEIVSSQLRRREMVGSVVYRPSRIARLTDASTRGAKSSGRRVPGKNENNLTDLQIWGCELHKNAFGGGAPRWPAGGAITLPQIPSR